MKSFLIGLLLLLLPFNLPLPVPVSIHPAAAQKANQAAASIICAANGARIAMTEIRVTTLIAKLARGDVCGLADSEHAICDVP